MMAELTEDGDPGKAWPVGSGWTRGFHLSRGRREMCKGGRRQIERGQNVGDSSPSSSHSSVRAQR